MRLLPRLFRVAAAIPYCLVVLADAWRLPESLTTEPAGHPPQPQNGALPR